MILEFNDNTSIYVENIFGAPYLYNGLLRDTLRIEVDPDKYSIEELEDIFKNKDKTIHLYTRSSDVIDDDYLHDRKVELGDGYCLFISVTDEDRKINPPPGKLMPDQYKRVFIVSISQWTYDEYQNYINSR